MMEENGLVLDYLPSGRSDDIRREPVAYIIGEKYFTLLEAVIKRDLELSAGDRIYIGKDIAMRKEVERIKGRTTYAELTVSAKNELKGVIQQIVHSREQEFVDFFNKCGPITIRQHQLELLPGIGKKHLEEILTERDKKKFESFKDISSRIAHLQNPEEIVAQRIIEELIGSRYYIFTRPPSLHPPGHGEYGHGGYGGGYGHERDQGRGGYRY